MLKLEHGNSAIGATVVSSAEELRKRHRATTECFGKEADYQSVGLGHGTKMLVMEYHGGTEHDLDVVIYGNKLGGAFISDNGPTHFPSVIKLHFETEPILAI